jgi:REP element-mobilizing transposase RayT
MADTYVQQRIHLVWSTRKREATIADGFRSRVWAYIGGIIRHCGGVGLITGGTADHIHVYADYPKTIALSQFVNKIKSNSSKWINEERLASEPFHWQSGYGAFSVGRSGDRALQEYIRNQEEHHRTMTFDEEYVRLLRCHDIAFDSRYVLD